MGEGPVHRLCPWLRVGDRLSRFGEQLVRVVGYVLLEQLAQEIAADGDREEFQPSDTVHPRCAKGCLVGQACFARGGTAAVFSISRGLGGLGHEAISELAFLELDDTARQRVIALIQQDEEFATFRASCNWPDRPRQRASEHFVISCGS